MSDAEDTPPPRRDRQQQHQEEQHRQEQQLPTPENLEEVERHQLQRFFLSLLTQFVLTIIATCFMTIYFRDVLCSYRNLANHQRDAMSKALEEMLISRREEQSERKQQQQQQQQQQQHKLKNREVGTQTLTVRGRRAEGADGGGGGSSSDDDVLRESEEGSTISLNRRLAAALLNENENCGTCTTKVDVELHSV
jgi:hypothetical protein